MNFELIQDALLAEVKARGTGVGQGGGKLSTQPDGKRRASKFGEDGAENLSPLGAMMNAIMRAVARLRARAQARQPSTPLYPSLLEGCRRRTQIAQFPHQAIRTPLA